MPKQQKKLAGGNSTLREIVWPLAQVKKFEQALKITNRIEDEHIKGRALKEVVKVMAEVKTFEQALEIINRIEDGLANELALRELVRVQVKQGMFAEALALAQSIDKKIRFTNSLLYSTRA